jgi:putative tryptophan/tyrosine transport system substrate-binding protein
MKRRHFVILLTGIAGASILRPPAVRAQQAGRVRRIGVLSGGTEGDPVQKDRVSWIAQGLAELGWAEGRNVQLEVRWGAGDPGRMQTLAKELVGLQPDVILVNTPAATKTMQAQTHTIPIVFNGVGDPVASGVLTNIARPEGNATGVTNYFPSMGGKWLELLKEAVPRVSRIGLIFNPDISTGAYFGALEAAAAQFSVMLVKIPYRDAADIVHTIDAFSAEPNGGLILLPPGPSGENRALINRLAVQHLLPVMVLGSELIAEGGLMSYGPNNRDIARRTASYLDRILRGAKPAELPVQFPTKFELIVNLKTAKAMGLTISESVLLRADELIE